MVYIKSKTLEFISSIMVTASIVTLFILSYAYYFHF